MSFEAAELARRAQIRSGPCKAILSYLCNRADARGENIYPSVRTIARDTGYSERTVQNHIRGLMQSGILVLVQAASGKPGKANRYKLDLAALWRLASRAETPPSADSEGATALRKTGAAGAPVTGAGDAPVDQETGAGDAPTGAGAAPKQSCNELKTQRACASEADGQEPAELVTYRNYVLELHGSELEEYLKKFDGDRDALNSALIQAAANIQPNSSRPLLVQVRAQLQFPLNWRRERKRLEEARSREQITRQLAAFGRTKSGAIKAKQASDARLDAPLKAPVWKPGDREEVELYRSESPFFAPYVERLRAAGRHDDADTAARRGWVKEYPSKFTGRKDLA
ncbi:MAG: helix-turn-helix domain-containing protein [Hyphomicrobiales bacterium]|nr:MAG: helix-turn-helix domain-containing protein [Hyphomicrobiales bacterium]